MKSALAQLPLLHLRFYCTSQGITMPDNPGSAWHGGFGKALHDIGSSAYATLYGDRSGSLPHPYILRPPQGHTALAKGQSFEFALILIGPALAELNAILAAIDLWSRLGVGPGLGKFSVERIEQQLPNSKQHMLYGAGCAQPPQMHSAAELYLDARPIQQLDLQLVSPLLVKQDNGHLRQAPALDAIAQRLLNRIDMMLKITCPDIRLGMDNKRRILEQIANAQLAHSDLQWQDQARYSARQKSWMPFGGLTGQLRYHGQLDALAPWLPLLEWLHLGNKTTFGQGQISCQAQ